MLVGKEDVFWWAVEKIIDKAATHFIKQWFGTTGVLVLIALGLLVLIVEAHMPQKNAREAAADAVVAAIGRVILALLVGALGFFCGGVAWAILARTFPLVHDIGGPDGPAIASVVTAVIALVWYYRSFLTNPLVILGAIALVPISLAATDGPLKWPALAICMVGIVALLVAVWRGDQR